MPEQLPRQSYSVPAIGGGDVIVQSDRESVMVAIDQGPGKDGMLAALRLPDALRLAQHLLDAHEEVTGA